jgi:hypothetical protein
VRPFPDADAEDKTRLCKLGPQTEFQAARFGAGAIAKLPEGCEIVASWMPTPRGHTAGGSPSGGGERGYQDREDRTDVQGSPSGVGRRGLGLSTIEAELPKQQPAGKASFCLR